MTYTYHELLDKNREYLWNPFTQMKEYLQEEPTIIESGQGVHLRDVQGNVYYDGYASLWVNPLGHNHPKLNQAIKEQLDQIAHSTLLGSANIPSILLAEKLVQLTPSSLHKVFFSDSGAEAVEIALKMAFLYWRHRGKPEKNTFISMKNAYHGDTVGAVSVGGMDLFHAAFDKLLFATEKVSYPHPYRFPGTEAECIQFCLDELTKILQHKSAQIAALVVEPMVQGASGMIIMPAGFLIQVAALCREFDVLLICDEVATGFGRTGRLFACEHEGIQPDLMALGKKLTGGYLPVAATLASNEIYDAFYGDYAEGKTFYHGHSYTGNQLGCAVALANLAVYEEEKLVSHVQQTSQAIQPILQQFTELPHVGEVRQLGLMIGIELIQDRHTKQSFPAEALTGRRVCRRAKELGLLTRPLDDVITFLPPLISTKKELDDMLRILYTAIKEVTEPCQAESSSPEQTPV